jgi:hypothetical protein
VNAVELGRRLLDAVNDLREASDDLNDAVKNSAERERVYRVRKSQAITRALAEGARNEDEREAMAESYKWDADDSRTLSTYRYERDLAEGLRISALERVRSLRQVVSAWQSVAALTKAEAEMARFGPDEGEAA